MNERDETTRRLNYLLCSSIDMIKLGIVLDAMVEAGVIDGHERRCFHVQAAGLLASMRNHVYKSVGEPTVTPII